VTNPEEAPEERRRIYRKATSLKNKRARELSVQYGGPLSSGVLVELVAWARDSAWAEYYSLAGDAVRASTLAEKASGHGLKALALAEREAEARDKARPVDPFEDFYKAANDGPDDREARDG
jgi:hypothetical protein